MSPLTKKHRDKRGLVERFELMINGKEIANAYAISANTARSYLAKLAQLKLLLSTKDGKTMLYIAPSDMLAKLNRNKR